MSNFFSFNLWFNMRPGILTQPYQNILGGLLVLFLLATFVLRIVKNKNGKNLYFKFWSGLYSFFLTNTIIGTVLFLFCYEMIPLLSARFWFLVWLIEIIVWLIFLVKNLMRIPEKKIEMEKEQQFKKYLP